ncbi:MAG: AmmeMemoRadiSam system radical SAM enzyme [Thermoplasmatota archaeon]
MGREADLGLPAGDGRIICVACARRCTLREGQTGLCGVRAVEDGRLRLLVYGRVITGHVDPIEKKPVSHYRAGTRIFSVATTGCNWLCKYCQNYDISQRREVAGQELSPTSIADLAVASGADGLAYTYNEPSIFLEFARDIGLEARRRGLFNIFVSNGYGTPEGAREMEKFLDCITVDFKGNAEPSFVRKYIGIPDPEPIFDTLHELRRGGKVHVEITDLVVPKVGDSEEACRRLSRRIYDEFGPMVPIHFLRWHPDYRMRDLPITPVDTLERHVEIARSEGLLYAYVGNVPGHPLEHTRCHACGNVVVERYGFEIRRWNLHLQGGANHCDGCDAKVPIEGPLSPHARESRFFRVV